MCLAAIHWAKIDRVVFGATIADAAAAGFCELHVDAKVLAEMGKSPLKVESGLLREECAQLFELWKKTDCAGHTDSAASRGSSYREVEGNCATMSNRPSIIRSNRPDAPRGSAALRRIRVALDQEPGDLLITGARSSTSSIAASSRPTW